MSWNKSKDVFALMCGHGTQLNGKWDSGCVYGKYTEADLMLEITKTAVKYLRLAGVKVLTDADKDNNRNMTSCVKWANKEKAKYYMSVHCDYKLASAGVAPLYVSSKGKKMAVAVGKAVAKSMGMKWKGAFKRTDLYELNVTDMPAVIFECGAIKADLKYLKDYKKYGKALADAICKFIGVAPYKKPATVTPAPVPVKSEAQQINDKAIELAWAAGTAASKYAYKGGAPTEKFKAAWKKYFPDKTNKAGCHQAVSLVLKTLGYPTMPTDKWSNILGYLKKHFTQVPFDYKESQLKAGDIWVRADKTNGKTTHHIMLIVNVNGKLAIAEAQQSKTFFHINTNIKKAVKRHDDVWLFRAK